MDNQATSNVSATRWLAVDWGTSNLRVWAMGANGEVLASLTSDRGMSELSPAQYEEVLIDLVKDHLAGAKPGMPLKVVICGMAGSRSGWMDAGYTDAPVNAGELSGSVVAVPTSDARIDVRILSGLRQLDPPDVMRGEETQLAGFATSYPGFIGHVCLPGTHSKWVSFEASRISRNRTIMTGELFAVLREHSILAHSLPAPGEATGTLPTGAFLEGVELGYGAPGGAIGELFLLRAGDLVGEEREPIERLAMLSGLLIGSEFAAIRPTIDMPIMFVGSERLGPLYTRAARHLGFDADAQSGDQLVLAGLKRAYELLQNADTGRQEGE